MACTLKGTSFVSVKINFTGCRPLRFDLQAPVLKLNSEGTHCHRLTRSSDLRLDSAYSQTCRSSKVLE